MAEFVENPFGAENIVRVDRPLTVNRASKLKQRHNASSLFNLSVSYRIIIYPFLSRMKSKFIIQMLSLIDLANPLVEDANSEQWI